MVSNRPGLIPGVCTGTRGGALLLLRCRTGAPNGLHEADAPGPFRIVVTTTPETAGRNDGPASATSPRLLVTAGPTHEPIDAVRFLGNRSSGRVGIAIAEAGARRGWPVTLLLGPTGRAASDSRIHTERFRTTADLEGLLAERLPASDILIMAAAVADYRPKTNPEQLARKWRRKSAMTLALEPTPDLLAGCAGRRRPGQLLVGFALEPAGELLSSARSKLDRKGIDLVVGNPLETMDGETIEAVVLGRDGAEHRTPGAMSKEAFGVWLLDLIERMYAARTWGC